MKIAICDDEEIGRKKIVKEIEANDFFSENVHLTEFASGEKLVKQYEEGFKADIVFLDIQMDKMCGIESAKHIRAIDKKAIIIFVSSHSEKVFNTFDCGVFYFIVKPFSNEHFRNVLEKAIDKYKSENTYFTVTWKNEIAHLNIQEMKYMERSGRHVTFYTNNGNYKADASLSEIFEELEPYGFIQTHQGYLVNMNWIKTFEGNDVILSDGSKVMMSVRKRTEVIRTFTNYIRR